MRLFGWTLKQKRDLPRQVGTGKQVAVLGALRTGTNVVRSMIEANWNLNVNFSSYGWKHAAVPILAPDSGMHYPSTPIVYVAKNPYAFVVSLYRYRQLGTTKGYRISLRGEEEFDAFLRCPITVFDSQLSGSPEFRFANPLHYWNFVYWNLQTLDPEAFPNVGVNYEDLISDPRTLSVIESIVAADRTTEQLVLPDQAMIRGRDNQNPRGATGTGTLFDISYYAEKRYLDSYTDAQLEFIRIHADHQVMQQCGYDFI